MASPSPSPVPSPSRSRRRPVLLGCFGALLLLTLVVSWQRQALLRWLVEASLGHVLQAEVHLATLEHRPGGRWQLKDLEITEPVVEPRLRHAKLPRIDLHLPWSALRRGILPEVVIHGGTLHLEPRAESIPTDDPPPVIERLRLIDLRLSWEDGGPGRSMDLDADLSHPTTTPRGEMRLQAPWLDLGSLLQAVLGSPATDAQGRQEDLDLHLQWTDAGPSLQLHGGGLEWRLADTQGRSEPWSLTFDAETAVFRLAMGKLSIEGNDQQWQEDGLIVHGEATPPDIDGVQGWRLHAETTGRWFDKATWNGTWSPAGTFESTALEVVNWRWKLPEGATATLDSRLGWQGGQWDVDTLLHTLDRPSYFPLGDGPGLALRPPRLPLRAHFEGRLQSSTKDPDGDAPSWFDGTASLQSAEDLRISARGAWHLLEDPPRLDVQLDAPGISLRSLQEMLEVPLLPAPWHGAGRIAVTGSLQGPLTSPHGHFELKILEATLESSEGESDRILPRQVQLHQAAADVRLLEVAPWPTVQWQGVTAQGNMVGPKSVEARFQWDGAFELDADQRVRRLDLRRLELDGGPLGKLQGSGVWRAEGTLPRAEARLDVSGVDMAAFLNHVPILAQHELLRDSALQGSLRGSWTLALNADHPTQRDDVGPALRVYGPLTLEGLGYASADSSRVVEGAGLRLDSTLLLTGDGRWQGSLDGDMDGFLLLWGTFFGDFEAWKGELSLQAQGTAPWPLVKTPQTPPTHLTSMASTLSWPEGPRLELSLRPDEASEATWLLDANLSSDSLASLHGRYLVPSFGEAVGQQLAGQLDLEAKTWLGPDSIRVEGQLHLRDTAWIEVAGTSIEGLQLDLPFGLTLPDDKTPGPRQTGRLGFHRATAGGFQLPATDTELWTEGAALGLVESLELPMYGGRMALRELQIRDLLDQPRLRAALSLDALDLEVMTQELGLPALAGQLNGELARVDITQQNLHVDGGGSLALFGGRIDIGEISGSDIFTPFPRIELSADLHDLDLGQLTRQVDFGEMHGTLQGSIEGCSLFRGIPVTCRARFETVHRSGVRRSVDVKAVNNLTVLGTGARTNVFDRGIQRLFNRFTYDRFGVSIDLANDSLLLKGLEQRGGKELFMSGRLPFPIDIVNAQPGRRVSFQAMLDRLETLDFEGVTTTAPPP